MAVNWKRCDRLQTTAVHLLDTDESLSMLDGVRIEYLQRDDTPRSGDKALVGGVQKVTGVNAFLAGEGPAPGGDPFFAIWVPEWALGVYREERAFEGLVDHLLRQCHAGMDEDGVVKISKLAPDFAGYAENIRRFGFWWQDARDMWEAMREGSQLRLPLHGGAEVHGTGSLEPGDLDRRGTPLADLEVSPAAAGSAVLDGDGESDTTDPGWTGSVADAIGAEPPLTMVAGGAEHLNGDGGRIHACGHWISDDEAHLGCSQCQVAEGLRQQKLAEAAKESEAAGGAEGWDEQRKTKRAASRARKQRGELDGDGAGVAAS